MDYFPLFMDIRQRSCLIVGGGDVALRKARILKEAGAFIRIVAHQVSDELKELLNNPEHQIYERGFCQNDLDDAFVVIAATDQQATNQLVAESAKRKNLIVNVVDSPADSNAIMPAIVDRSPVIAAFSTGGKAPVLARMLREKLESLLPSRYGSLATLAGRYRSRVIGRFDSINDRRRFWETIFSGPAAEAALNGDEEGAEREIETQLANQKKQKTGEVYLVGAGPGDPDLLTFRALRLMQQADVVLYDRLVSEPIRALCRRDAEYIYVGKKCAKHIKPQPEINDLLVEQAKMGKRVLRLKGGDPFIFGRGGEELESLARENIPFQVVPGITAASGCASYAGIPLTHRDHAQSVRFVTGHEQNNGCSLDWQSLSKPNQTLVFYMGLLKLGHICDQLITHGCSARTPAALIEKGTTTQQRVITADLSTLPSLVKEKEIRSPALIIIGGVVKLQASLNWKKFTNSSSEI